MARFPDNPGPLPAARLCNDVGPPDPIKGEGPLRRGDGRTDLVKQLQMMLVELGFDIGDTGPNGDGVDEDYGSLTDDAVRSFQGKHKDWEGEQLSVDSKVGPRTSDALNRALVGIWYDHYQTPPELLDEDSSLDTVTPDFLTDGLEMDLTGIQKAQVIIVGALPHPAFVAPKFLMPTKPDSSDTTPIDGLFAYIPTFASDSDNTPQKVDLFEMEEGLLTDPDSGDSVNLKCSTEIFIYFSSDGTLRDEDVNELFQKDGSGLNLQGPIKIPCEDNPEIQVDVWSQTDWVTVDPIETFIDEDNTIDSDTAEEILSG